MGKQVKKHVCIAVCVNSMWLFICGHRMVGQGTGMGKQVRKYVCIGVCVNSMWLFFRRHRMLGRGTTRGKQEKGLQWGVLKRGARTVCHLDV